MDAFEDGEEGRKELRGTVLAARARRPCACKLRVGNACRHAAYAVTRLHIGRMSRRATYPTPSHAVFATPPAAAGGEGEQQENEDGEAGVVGGRSRSAAATERWLAARVAAPIARAR